MNDLKVDNIVIIGGQPIDTSGISSWRMTNVVPKWIELFSALSYCEEKEKEIYRDENNSIVAIAKKDFAYANKNYAVTVMHDEHRKQSHVSVYTVSVSNDGLSMIGWKTLQYGETFQLDLYTDVDLIAYCSGSRLLYFSFDSLNRLFPLNLFCL